jgi:dihydrofolate reductase
MIKQRKVVLYTAASLDGFLATEDHNLEWLFAVEGEGDNGYSEFFDTVDTILLGRVTYDWLMDYEKGNFPYKDKECYVFSRSKRDNTNNVTFVDEDIVPFIQELKKKKAITSG